MNGYRRWIMLWRGLKQLSKEDIRVWRNEQGHMVYFPMYTHYDRCWELNIPYELIEPRRKMRLGKTYKHKGKWYRE